ncbi:probable C-mannosyltransferase DPY19L1 [Maniola jurtina]|uniref:probable C-mannosyltransferase DPY19L1 n=1 Tax=Maniola jurtina TaxID=191418 RepID=UPI001E68A280|nr:probable C-mannosyltransferase DPY19L1 [Maniola jurtina]
MEENTAETPTSPNRRRFNRRKFFAYGSIIIAAISIGCVHYHYVTLLFENDRNFSFLSELEREMSFRTEMGFYYSYYKTVVEERPYLAGIYKLMYDRLVEYPKDVNAFNRFNIHPEVIIGSVYRYFEPWLNTTYFKECHMIARGDGHTPVESCIGIGQPIFFYLEAIWWLAGVTVAALFLHATVLSQSLLGGTMAVLQYFANHSECTRVQWAPNERENLAAPLLLLQSWLLTLQLRSRNTLLQLQISIFTLNCLCLLFWQFTQFIFLTQIAIFFVMEQLKIIDIKSLSIFLHCHFCGLHTAVLLLQGNDMLKSSLYTCFFFIISMYCLFFSFLRIKVRNRLDFFVECWLVLLRICMAIFGAFYLKKVISDSLDVQEDSHIWDILYSKLTNFQNFHTLLYTCSEVFDFLPLSSIKNMTKSLLIPFVLISCVNVVTFWIKDSIHCYKKEMANIAKESNREGNNEDEDSGIENTETVKKRTDKDTKDLDLILCEVDSETKENVDPFMVYVRNVRIDPSIFYNLSQMAVFGVMAALVMRLKLLFSTQMCIVSSLVVNKTHIFPKWMSKYGKYIWAVALLPVFAELTVNVNQEMSHIGEFSDYPQEELLQWISKEAGSGAFAGSMPVLATVMLATRRPIVAHPHYEHLEARQRAYSVYKVYGRFSSEHLYQEMTKLRATYLIVETKYCYGRSRRGCSFENIWDIEAPALKSNPKLCHVLLTEPVEHFYPVFRNEHYAVFRIHDFSVRYMPRSFDT